MSSYMDEYREALEKSLDVPPTEFKEIGMMEMLNKHLEEGFNVENTLPNNFVKPKNTEIESTTTGPETNRTETVQITIFFSSLGFILGALVAFIVFKRKLRAIKAEYEVRIDEARTSIDRMLKIASK